MLGFRTPVMSVAFNSMAAVVTGAAQQQKGMKEVLPLDRESWGLGFFRMELFLCCFKRLNPFKLIAVGDENSPRRASKTDVTWLTDKACIVIAVSWVQGLSLKFISHTCRSISYHMGNRERFVG